MSPALRIVFSIRFSLSQRRGGRKCTEYRVQSTTTMRDTTSVTDYSVQLPCGTRRATLITVYNFLAGQDERH